jgi:murein DD-endopeptidase MepM/ murein hydrolase activator NlpD
MQRNPGPPEPPARSLARVRLFVLALLIVLTAPAPAAGAWRLPVYAPVARGFDLGANPYEGGRHRGVDLRAPGGSVIRSPCGGRVAVAGRIGSSGGVVTVLCGHWRATVLPLSTILVHRGAQVSTRTRLGLLARSTAHRGLHLGIRRDGARFGYVDPLRFFPARPTGPSPLGRAPRGRPTPPATPVRPLAARSRPAPTLRIVAHPSGAAAPRGHAARGELAPWPAWAGLALVLVGLGVGARRRGRSRGERRLRGAAAARS